MFVDAAGLEPDAQIQADVCVVGSGPAGLTLVRELTGRGLRVALLESGDLSVRQRAKHLGIGQVRSEDAAYARQRLHRTRRRAFGGTGNAWNARSPRFERNVRLVPLEDIDFETRRWLPGSGWPFSRAHLQPYYARAAVHFGVDGRRWEPRDWATEGRPAMDVDPTLLGTRMFQFADAGAFVSGSALQMLGATDVTVFLGATAETLHSDGGRIREVVALTAPGRRLRVTAHAVVLACGAVENARLLLASGSETAPAPGNSHDLVGRYFMDHPAVRCGVLLPADPNVVREAGLYDIHVAHGAPVVAKLTLAADAVRARRSMHSAFQLFARPAGYRPEFMEHLKYLMEDFDVAGMGRAMTGWGSQRIGRIELAAARRWFKGRLNMGWSSDPSVIDSTAFLEVVQKTEQAPDRDNRVVLSDRRDALGCRTADLHWRWTDGDRRSVRHGQQVLAEAVAEAGVGRLVIASDEDGDPVLSRGTNHHMGTTRMHPDPRFGVVDANGQVHGTANLYVAGASTFPTGGYANPTLTIGALSVRLADHLLQQGLRREVLSLGAMS